MFHPRYRRYIKSFLLVFPMTGIVCAINTFVARGFLAVFSAGTLERWAISCIVAFPCVLLIQPLAAKLTNRLIKAG